MSIKNTERQFVLEFIKVYRSLPALWDIKCKDYTNRGKKNEQYDVLIDKYRENVPNAGKQDVVKKINSLRTNFRKELKRIRDAEKIGANPKDTQPSLWYFEEMRFLQNLEAPTPSTSSNNQLIDSNPPLYNSAVNETADKIIYQRPTSESKAKFRFHGKKKKAGGISEQLVELTCKYLKRSQDYHNTITAAWAMELKNMEPTQQMLAKKFINEILFEGQMGTLHRDSVIINNASRTSSPFSVQSLPSFSKFEPDIVRRIEDPI